MGAEDPVTNREDAERHCSDTAAENTAAAFPLKKEGSLFDDHGARGGDNTNAKPSSCLIDNKEDGEKKRDEKGEEPSHVDGGGETNHPVFRRNHWFSPNQPVGFNLKPVGTRENTSDNLHYKTHVGNTMLNKKGSSNMRYAFSKSSSPEKANDAFLHKGWTKLKAAGYAAPAATNVATAAGKHAARLGKEAAKRSAKKAVKAVKVLRAVQGELDSAARLQRMLGIQKYTEDERLQQLVETEAYISPDECLQYDLKVLQYYTSTEKDIELRNRRARSFIYSPPAQIFMALVIIFNILFLGISTMEITVKSEDDHTGSQSQGNETDPVQWNKALFIFITVSNVFFAVVFFLEMVLRIKCDRLAYFKDVVNITDFVNAWLGIVDLFFTILHYMDNIDVNLFQSVAAGLRLMRLLRVLRFIRILKTFLPMRVLVDGMKASFFSLVYAMCFFLVLIYGFAVFFTTAFGTTRALQEYWGDLFTSMYSLFLILTMTNWDVIAAKTAAYYKWAKAVVILYTVFSFFVLFNVVTAVIVEAFSSAATRLQGEAMHYAMFNGCQEDEKTFSKALTKSHLLSAVSGISLSRHYTVSQPSSPDYAADCAQRETPAQQGGGDLLESTKSSQVCAAANRTDYDREEPHTSAEDGNKAKGSPNQRAAPVFVSVEKRAVSAASGVSSIRRDVPCKDDREAEPKGDKGKAGQKFPSSLFASFILPSASIVQREDDGQLTPNMLLRKRLKCVRGVLTTQTASRPPHCEHEASIKNSIIPHSHVLLLPKVAPAVVQTHSARPQDGAADGRRGYPAEGENSSCTGSSALPVPACEAETLPQPSTDQLHRSTSFKTPREVHSAEDFFKGTSAERVVDDLKRELLLSNSKAEASSDNEAAAAAGEDEEDAFETQCGRVYDNPIQSRGSAKPVLGACHDVPCIDLRRSSPLQVLSTRAVQLAMRKCGISYIQAYDCLNILLQKGFEEVTGRPTARQLFLLELDLDRAFRHLNAKMTRLLSLLQSYIDEGFIALPSPFPTNTP